MRRPGARRGLGEAAAILCGGRWPLQEMVGLESGPFAHARLWCWGRQHGGGRNDRIPGLGRSFGQSGPQHPRVSHGSRRGLHSWGRGDTRTRERRLPGAAPAMAAAGPAGQPPAVAMATRRAARRVPSRPVPSPAPQAAFSRDLSGPARRGRGAPGPVQTAVAGPRPGHEMAETDKPEAAAAAPQRGAEEAAAASQLPPQQQQPPPKQPPQEEATATESGGGSANGVKMCVRGRAGPGGRSGAARTGQRGGAAGPPRPRRGDGAGLLLPPASPGSSPARGWSRSGAARPERPVCGGQRGPGLRRWAAREAAPPRQAPAGCTGEAAV